MVYMHLLSHKVKPVNLHNPVVEVVSVFNGSDELMYLINHSYNEAYIADMEGEPIVMHGIRKDQEYIIEPRGVVVIAKR